MQITNNSVLANSNGFALSLNLSSLLANGMDMNTSKETI